MSEIAVPAGNTPTGAMIRTLGLVSLICGLIIVGTYEGTFSAAEANRQRATERAVFKVIPGARSIRTFVALPGGTVEANTDGSVPPGAVKFYGAYDDGGKLAGIAAEAAAKGYADTVRIMFGYTPGCQCVTGIGVVSMRETPGIGDKIITDQEFLANFKSLDVKLTKDLSALANEVKVVKHGTKKNAWEIDAISGATVTSRAVGRGINASAQALLPRLVPNIEKLRSKSS